MRTEYGMDYMALGKLPKAHSLSAEVSKLLQPTVTACTEFSAATALDCESREIAYCCIIFNELTRELAIVSYR